MPTVEQFEQAARLLEEAEADARQLVRPVERAMGPEVFAGGRLTDSIDAAIATARTDAGGLAVDLGELAEECRSRAAAVAAAAAAAADYRNAVTRYREDAAAYDADPDLAAGRRPEPPIPPPAPPAWAEF